MEQETFLTKLDLARRWRCSGSKISNDIWLRRSIPFVRIGRSIRFRLSDIEAHEKARLVIQRTGAPPEGAEESTSARDSSLDAGRHGRKGGDHARGRRLQGNPEASRSPFSTVGPEPGYRGER